MIDQKTPHLQLPLPHESNELQEDLPRLQASFKKLDAHAKLVDAHVKTAAETQQKETENREQAITALNESLETETKTREKAIQNLPTMSAAVKGMAKVGSGLQMEADVLSAFLDTGLVIKEGKIALDYAVIYESMLDLLFPKGADIRAWFGALKDIPTGWVLCDGNNGTKDMRDKVLIGAGRTFPVNSMGGSFKTGKTILSAAQTSKLITTIPIGWDVGGIQAVSFGWHANTANINTYTNGGNQPHDHDNLQPYVACYFIQRI